MLEFDFGESVGGSVSAHDGEFGGGPGKHEAGIVGLATHGVVARAKTAADDHGNFGDDAVGYGVDHFCAGADDAAPFGVFADHEAVDVVKENERDAVLVAIHDEAGGFLGGLGVDDAAKFGAFLVGMRSVRADVFFLVGNDADGPATDAGVAAKQSFAIFGAIFLEVAGVDDAGDDFAHVVLLGRIAGEYAVEFVGGVEGFVGTRWLKMGGFGAPILSTRARMRLRQDSSSGSRKSTVPLIWECIFAPPNSSAVDFWPMAACTRAGPARKRPEPSVIRM